MKLLVCTANQPRHVALVKALLTAGHDALTIVEPKSYVWPVGAVMQKYWARVRQAEAGIFGDDVFMPGPVLALRPGELSALPGTAIQAMQGRLPIVFSSSYIKGEVADAFIAAGALNLHAGIAPEYRGSAPNMWAQYNGRPDLIGAQVQRLSQGLDTGAILAEVKPGPDGDYFHRSMKAVQLGIEALVHLLNTPEPWPHARVNDRSFELSYTRHDAFTDKIAQAILESAQ